MVWVAETQVVQHVLEYGSEHVRIPVRVKLEFEVSDGMLVPDTLSFEMLYNRLLLEKRYPGLDVGRLESAIAQTAHEAILKHLRQSRYPREEGDSSA